MAISYNKLWKLLIDQNITKQELTKVSGLVTHQSRNCDITDIMETISDAQ